MTTTWTQAEREAAYTALCEAVTAAGRENETQFLARLCLLLTEALADADAFQQALQAAVGNRAEQTQETPAGTS